MKGTYVRTVLDTDTYDEHLNDTPWYSMPYPHRLHRCWAQTREMLNGKLWREYCPCGARRYDDNRWLYRKSRRHA